MPTEREKMLAGELYLANDPDLAARRARARGLVREFNALPYTGEGDQQRQRVLKELLGRVGEKACIESPFYCDYGENIELGDNVFLNFNCLLLDCALIRIGNNVMAGPSVQFYAAYHPLNARERIAGPELAAPITVGDNVWLGGGAIICPGVTIGDNTTIGAGSVVTKDIPAGVLAVGNPCRVVRTLD